MDITSVVLESTVNVDQTNVPITFGQVFTKGHLPTGRGIELVAPDGGVLPCQVDIKKRHRDGSVRHASLTVIMPVLRAAASITYTLRSKAGLLSGTAPVPADFPDLKVIFTVTDNGIAIEGANAGTKYTADASVPLASGTYKVWRSGPLVSDWIVRVPLVSDTGVVHPDLHARFEIMVYKGMQRARVHARIENTWAKPKEVITTTPWENVSLLPAIYHYNLKIGSTVIDDLKVRGQHTARIATTATRKNTYGGTKTELPNDGTVFTASVMIDGVLKNISVIGSQVQTFTQLYNAITAQLGGLGVCDVFGGGSIRITSNTTGKTSSVVIDYGTLFTTLGVPNPYRPMRGDEYLHYNGTFWQKTFWWNDEPQVHVRHNRTYQALTQAEPNYAPELTGSETEIAATLAAMNANGGIGQNGITKSGMAAPGGAPGIGVLPRWQAMFAINRGREAKEVMMRQADLMGSWPVVRRDFDTDLPIDFAKWPYATFSPNSADAKNPLTGISEKLPSLALPKHLPASGNDPDVSHHPDFNFLPYLITADHCYMEGMLMYMTYCILSFNAAGKYRAGAKGLFKALTQVRGQAWSIRALAHTRYLLPDDHPNLPALDYINKSNIEYYNANFVDPAGPGHSKFGTLGGYIYSAGGQSDAGSAPFQEDHTTSAVGRAVELGFSEYLPLLQYKAKNQVGRLTSGRDYCWQLATIYVIGYRPTATSPEFSNWADIYQFTATAAMKAAECGSVEMGVAIGDGQNAMRGYPTSVEGFPANLQSAIAYAATFKLPGAADGWMVFEGRTKKPNYNTGPQFAIVPRTTVMIEPIDPGSPSPPPTEPIDPIDPIDPVDPTDPPSTGPTNPTPPPVLPPTINGKIMTIADRVKQTSTTTGLGDFVLETTPIKDFQPFYPAIDIGDTTPYAAICPVTGQWENGDGTLLSGNTLQRTRVTSSSSNGAKVNFLAGTKDVTCDLTAAFMNRYGAVDSPIGDAVDDPTSDAFLIEIGGVIKRVPVTAALSVMLTPAVQTLPDAGTLTNTDLFNVSRGAESMKTTLSAIAAAVAAINGSSPSPSFTVPGAPTNVSADVGNASALVHFTAPVNTGGKPVTSYIVTSATNKTATGVVSPINVTGLTNGTAVTFTVRAVNEIGTGAASAVSNSVTPVAPPVVGGTTATVKNLWTGTPTPEGAIVSVRLNTANTANSTRVACSTSADLSNPIFSAAVAPDTTFRIAKHVISNLQPNTQYYYGIEVDGMIDQVYKGKFKTLPQVNTPASFRLALGACSNHLSNYHGGTFPAWQAIREMSPQPLAFLHLGDIIYANSAATDESSKVGVYDSVLSSATGFATRHQTMREIPTLYMWDDHDFGPDNASGLDATNIPVPYRQATLDGFRRRVPAFIQSTDTSDTVDHFMIIGRVRVIMSDLRASRSGVNMADGPTKSLMGQAQKQRWKNHIAEAAAAGQFVVWCSSSTWIGEWSGYATERTELANHIKACGMSHKVCVIAGDMHAQAYHTGIDYATGGGAMTPVFQVGAIHSAYSTKGGPYTVGPVAQTETSNYGIMDVLDDGTTLTVHWKGKAANGDVVLLEHSFTGLGLTESPVITAPDTPPAPIAQAGENIAMVTITPPTNNGGSPVTGYTVISIPAGGIDNDAGSTNLDHVIGSLTPGVSYAFTVKASNVIGTSEASPVSNSVIPTAPVINTVFDATGGTVTEVDGYKYWEFKATETINITSAGPVEYLVVAGGGGGSGHGTGKGAGGGAGGVRVGSLTLPAGFQNIKIGAGGLAGQGLSPHMGTNGENSAIGTLIEAIGGGAGGYGIYAANLGGSGGGAGAGDTSAGPGQGTNGQGFVGGLAYPSTVSSERASGGGGGAGGPGGAAPGVRTAGNGGAGVTVWNRNVGGGGGGFGGLIVDGGISGTATHGGGIGRTVKTENEAAMNGIANTGGGGGGSGGSTGSFIKAGNGGSGLVVIRRPITV